MSIAHSTAPESIPRKTTRRAFSLILAASVALVSFGCAFGEIRPDDPFDRQYTLDEAQHRYTVLVRFSDWDQAKDFVVEDQRDVFVKRMKALDDARFTDYESDSAELDSAKNQATFQVTYTIYTPAMPFEMEVVETQEWTRDGLSNNWQVLSIFDDLQKFAAN